MKCRACWADRAQEMSAPRWLVWVAACFLAVPCKCRHCFGVFLLPRWSPQRRRSHASTAMPQRLRNAA